MTQAPVPDRTDKAGFASGLRLRWMKTWAACILLIEKASPSLLGAATVAALFAAVSWFGLFRATPDLARYLLLFLFVFAFLASLAPLLSLRWPSGREANRLIEEREGLAHQPLQAQEDRPAFDTPLAAVLWRAHQQAMASKLEGLGGLWPRANLAAHDPYGLRAIPALLLVIGFAYAQGSASGRLSDALYGHQKAAERALLRMDAWITPPGYTGRPLVSISDHLSIDQVPENSELALRLSGGSEGDAANVSVEFLPETGVRLKLLPEQGASGKAGQAVSYRLKLASGGELVAGDRHWQIGVVRDTPPEIEFDGDPKRTVSGALEIPFKGKDDYGIVEARAEIRPLAEESDAEAVALYDPPDMPLDFNHGNSRAIKGVASRNLTDHPLSGKPVTITLVAIDGAGQEVRSQPKTFTLPARRFHTLLAAAVAEERQVFSLDIRRLPHAVEIADAILLRADEVLTNPTHFLLVSSARDRLRLARTRGDLKDVAAYLWDIALGIEDEATTTVERRLHDAEQALKEALDRNASPEEIASLMQELRKAMEAYVKALAEKGGKTAPPIAGKQPDRVLREQDLKRMLDQLEMLSRSGNKDAARDLLSQMQRLMNNLDAPHRQAESKKSPMQDQLDKMGKMLQEQQKLMEETHRLDQQLREREMMDATGNDQQAVTEPPSKPEEARPPEQTDPNQTGPNQPGQDQPMPDRPDQPGQRQQSATPQQDQAGPSPEGKLPGQAELKRQMQGLQGRQNDLAGQLDEVMKGLKGMGAKPAEGLDEAGRHMRGAGQALGDSDSSRALDKQGKALEAMRKGARDMMNRQGNGSGEGEGEGQQAQGSQGLDPLGRKPGADGNSDQSDVKVPDDIDVQRAREILDAIRRKLDIAPEAGTTPLAPDVERSYLERLLDGQ